MILEGCANGTSVAIEFAQTRPDDRGCDNDSVGAVSLITIECDQTPARVQGMCYRGCANKGVC